MCRRVHYICDEFVLLFCDASLLFIIIFSAWAPSHITYDEDTNFVIESSSFMTKFLNVTR